MNGMSLSHWGIITWPDDESWTNVLADYRGSISKFDDKLPMAIKVRVPFRPPFPLSWRSLPPRIHDSISSD